MQKMRKHEYPEKRTDRSRGAEISLQSLQFLRNTCYSGRKKEEFIEKLLCERVSQRGIARTVGVSRNRLILIIKKEIRPVASAIVKTEERPVVEMDEIWSFVGSKQYPPTTSFIEVTPVSFFFCVKGRRDDCSAESFLPFP